MLRRVSCASDERQSTANEVFIFPEQWKYNSMRVLRQASQIFCSVRLSSPFHPYHPCSRLDVMRPTRHTFKVWMSTFISLWVAVLACFMGCALPVLADQHHPGPMANMDCCHSGGKSPEKPTNGKSAPNQHGMSCCPLEVTVASKLDAATTAIAPPQYFVLASNLILATVQLHYSLELVPIVWHSGRDTLLETRLLRI